MPKQLDTISFTLVIDGKPLNNTFAIHTEAKPEDAAAIGVVMQKWLTKTLEAVL